MNPTYDSRTVFLHWLSAALVLVLWIVGQCIDYFPKGTPRVSVRSLHIALGVLLLVTVVVRVVWRRTSGVKLPPADSGAAGKIAIGVHHLLYALLIALLLLGLASVWFRGDNIFNLFTVPAFDPGNKALAHNTVEQHGLLANILLCVAGLHAAAAAWHHWGLKDGVLARMWPGLALRADPPRH